MSNELLKLANAILSSLQQDVEIEDEDFLFSDEFYITVVANIVPENSFDVSIGKSDLEKADNLHNLVNFLTGIVEVDLSHIKGRDIVYKRDEISAKHLLELIYELITILKGEQEDEDIIEGSSHSLPNQKESQTSNISDNINNENQKEEVIAEYQEPQSCPDLNIPNDYSQDDDNLNVKDNYSQNDVTRYEKVLQYIANNEEYDDNNKESSPNKNLEMENIFKNKGNIAYNEHEESKSINISHISEVSRSKENSEAYSNQKFKSGIIKGEDLKESKQTNSAMYKSNDKTNKISQQESYLPSKLSSIETQSKDNAKNNSKSKIESPIYHNRKTSSKKSDDRVLGRAKSQKQLMNNSYSKTKSDISNSSIENRNKKKSKYSQESDQLIGELPLSNENLEHEILNEFRKIYGNKFDNVILKNNMQNSNMLEMIIKNIKLAKNKMVELGNFNLDSDDVITKEFMVKYKKELDYIMKHYMNEEKKRNFLKQKAVNTLSRNTNLIKKIQEIEAKNMENEIERRKKSRDIKNKHYQIKLCNDIYAKALDYEKNRYLEERSIQMEIRKAENEEKRNILVQIENYYKDKINILKDILRKEKYEKEIEHRAKIQFLSKLERESKHNFKKQIDELFDRLDEEDRKNEFRNSKNNQLENILMNYYKKT